MATKFKTREQWLAACAKKLEALYKKHGYECSGDYKVSCGFPKSSGMGYNTIGQCWSKTVSEGKVSEMFISPILADAARVADVLAHELAHHIVGIKEGHNKVFGACVRAIGLEGPLTATTAGPEFQAWWEKTSPTLGDYPHHAMTPHGFKPKPGVPGLPTPKDPDDWETTPRRKSGRVVKWSCGCGMKFSTSITQAEQVKACPACGEKPEQR